MTPEQKKAKQLANEAFQLALDDLAVEAAEYFAAVGELADSIKGNCEPRSLTIAKEAIERARTK